eukprot:CAMPEP_0173400540 /NCGR_PEP_ID=MMETSP1356-20130122/48170_1 /TAXON_ID=77927 ORGANISM="Hemiselmis virescens, Strain PCC157" /NCGR_SAMPLE_ID=MMETSP1356 /ASSEMBLY_ACC=CAM_ASM_000847 /LENGTH=47 /DNA_ID= /DNA_START= /DNA_END= /DNA_ORIENTATION=
MPRSAAQAAVLVGLSSLVASSSAFLSSPAPTTLRGGSVASASRGPPP